MPIRPVNGWSLRASALLLLALATAGPALAQPLPSPALPPNLPGGAPLPSLPPEVQQQILQRILEASGGQAPALLPAPGPGDRASRPVRPAAAPHLLPAGSADEPARPGR